MNYSLTVPPVTLTANLLTVRWRCLMTGHIVGGVFESQVGTVNVVLGSSRVVPLPEQMRAYLR